MVPSLTDSHPLPAWTFRSKSNANLRKVYLDFPDWDGGRRCVAAGCGGKSTRRKKTEEKYLIKCSEKLLPGLVEA